MNMLLSMKRYPPLILPLCLGFIAPAQAVPVGLEEAVAENRHLFDDPEILPAASVAAQAEALKPPRRCRRARVDSHAGQEEPLWFFPPAWLILIPAKIGQSAADAAFESCLREQRVELAVSLRAQMALEGGNHIVSIPRQHAVGGVNATVDEIALAGYAVAVDDDAEYRLIRRGAIPSEPALPEQEAEAVLRIIMLRKYVPAPAKRDSGF